MTMYRSDITISRHWNHPEIITTVSNNMISVTMDLDDFKEALIAEIGSVATTFRAATFKDKVNKAVENVIERVKEETRKVM